MGDVTDLPEAFLARMRGLLGGEYEAFAASFLEKRQYGLRWNPLKATEEAFCRAMPFSLQRIPWAREGFSYALSADAESQPGRHPLQEAGAYYIQEPSAMAAVEALDPKPGERVLDLCAAPGGKATQIGGRMQGEGLLVANEMMQERARILSRNVERMGVANCLVCAEEPARLAERFPCFFDRILVDAPCSGEGMFRKDAAARGEWSPEAPAFCARRQAVILAAADRMLRPGGVLVYSTCTFSPEENEGAVSGFWKAHEGEYNIEETPLGEFLAPGRPEWVAEPATGIQRSLRLWPHLLRGEGHYVARLRKSGNGFAKKPQVQAFEKTFEKRRREQNGDKKLCKLIGSFLRDELGVDPTGLSLCPERLFRFGEEIYLLPAGAPDIAGLRVLRPGLHLLTEKKGRFEPAHAFAMALTPRQTERERRVSLEEARAFLRGESLSCGAERGWVLVSLQGYPLGFGKASGGQIKNHYPKGLRKGWQ